MKVSDIMSKEIETVAAEATVEGAAQIMAELDVEVLPVQERDELVGIVTERDIMVRVVAAGLIPAETRVADIMSSDVFCCGPDDDVEAVAAQMRERKVRQVPVVSEGRKLLGMVALSALRRREEPFDQSSAPRVRAEADQQ